MSSPHRLSVSPTIQWRQWVSFSGFGFLWQEPNPPPADSRRQKGVLVKKCYRPLLCGSPSVAVREVLSYACEATLLGWLHVEDGRREQAS